MKNVIINDIKKFLAESKDNWFKEINDHYYEEPIINFADPEDPLFKECYRIIGERILAPKEAFELAFGEGSYNGGSVISIVLPINQKIRESNRLQKEWPSREWVLAHTFGDDIFYRKLAKYLVSYFNDNGNRAVIPNVSKLFEIQESTSAAISNWSENYVAYVAGLGTYSINGAFITEKGVAIKLISVITDLKLTPDKRLAKSNTENCLLCSKGICGECIRRCPINAISKQGYDKIKCREYVYGEASSNVAELYGASPILGSGCGLCKTGVPCEDKNPMKFER